MEGTGDKFDGGSARLFGAAAGVVGEAAVAEVCYGAGESALGAYYRAVDTYNKQVGSACASFGGRYAGMDATRFCAEHFVRPVWYGDSNTVGRASGFSSGFVGRVGDGRMLDGGGDGLEVRRSDTGGVEVGRDVDGDPFVGKFARCAGERGSGGKCVYENESVDGDGKGCDVLSGRVQEEQKADVEGIEGSSVVGGRSSGRYAVGNVVERGRHYAKNLRKRANRKGRLSGEGACASVSGLSEVEKPKDALRLSLEEKWRLENELKIAKAKKELDLLQSEDREAIKKLRDRKVQGATERTMVQIEKAHASLVQSGNVPGVQPGFCQTVVDGEVVESVPGLSGGESKGCSISPSSSISEREVREMKKELEDLRLENEKLKRKQKRMPLAFDVLRDKEIVPVSVVDGRVPESAKEALDEVLGEGEWTYEGDLDVDPDTLYLRKEFFGFS